MREIERKSDLEERKKKGFREIDQQAEQVEEEQ